MFSRVYVLYKDVQLLLSCINAFFDPPVYLCIISCVCLCQDCEVLEAETKRFEDLEFQQLESESRQDEEKETHTQRLLRDIADYQRSTVTRKVTAICLGENVNSTILHFYIMI